MHRISFTEFELKKEIMTGFVHGPLNEKKKLQKKKASIKSTLPEAFTQTKNTQAALTVEQRSVLSAETAEK